MLLKRVTIIAAVLLLGVSLSMALDPLPKKQGWHGFVNLGPGVITTKSNLLAGNQLIDVGNETIDSVTDRPDKTDTAGIPAFNFQVGYFWESSRTLLFFGNQIEDLIRYDFTTMAGVRKGVGDAGVLSFEIVTTPIAADVWEDPYLVGSKRQDTERTSTGARLIWDKIGGTPLEIAVTGRDIEIDNERSGQSLPLTPAERGLLDRNGDLRQIEILYRFGQGRKHRFYPAVRYSDFDLDGGAEAHEQWRGQATYAYTRKGFVFTTNLFFGSNDYDEVNPIYGVTRDEDVSGVTLTTLFGGLFGSERWIGIINAAYYERDANIDFYDSEASVFTLSALYRF